MSVDMRGLGSIPVLKKPIVLQGHKAEIHKALDKPRGLHTLYRELKHIPQSSIRRNLSEMKYMGLVEKHPDRKDLRGKAKWRQCK